MDWIPVLIGISAVSVAVIYFERGWRRKSDRFTNREALSIDDIYEKYFSNQGIPKNIMAKLWIELADTLELPSEKLRPTDSFQSDLAPENGFEFDDQLGGLAARIEAKFKKIGKKPDLNNIKTIKDYIMSLAEIEQDHG